MRTVKDLSDIELEARILIYRFRMRQFGDPWTQKEKQCFPKEYKRSLFSIVGPYERGQ